MDVFREIFGENDREISGAHCSKLRHKHNPGIEDMIFTQNQSE